MIDSNTRRSSLSDLGVNSPCTFNVIWDGGDQRTIGGTEADDNTSSQISQRPYTPPQREELKLEIGRTFIFKDFVGSFKNKNISKYALWLIPVNTNGKREEANDFGGGYQEVKYFPLQLNRAFIIATFFGEIELQEDVLMESFMKYLPSEESARIVSALEKEYIDISEDEDLMDILSSLGSKRILKGNCAQFY
eukprot:gene1846-2079_t